MAETQKIVILDFGGQYTQLIARRVRECKVYSEVLPYHASVEQIRAIEPKGIILSLSLIHISKIFWERDFPLQKNTETLQIC